MVGRAMARADAAAAGLVGPVNTFNAFWVNIAPYRKLLGSMRGSYGLRGNLGLLLHRPGWIVGSSPPQQYRCPRRRSIDDRLSSQGWRAAGGSRAQVLPAAAAGGAALSDGALRAGAGGLVAAGPLDHH